jgi:hypothetical protein
MNNSPFFALLLALPLAGLGCNNASPGGGASASAAPKASSAPAAKASGSAAPAAASAASSAAAPAAGADLSVLGGKDFKAVFAGEAPMKLKGSMGGGAGTGMADDYTRETSHPADLWKFNAAGGGGVFWGPSGKAVAINNINIKRDADQKAVDTWIKSALVTDVKHTNGPEVNEVGPTKALANTGAGTCKLKTGEQADFYWWDVYSPGDFAHELMIVIIAKDAPAEDKKVALSILRQVAYTAKAKPHFKKP